MLIRRCRRFPWNDVWTDPSMQASAVPPEQLGYCLTFSPAPFIQWEPPWPKVRSRFTRARTGGSRRPQRSWRRRTPTTVRCGTRPRPTTRLSGPVRPVSCLCGTRISTPCSSGSCRSRNGLSAASSTSPTTAWTATSRLAKATRSRSTGRVSPATRSR